MELNNNQLSQSVRDTVSRLPVFETEVGQTVTRIDGDISARATKSSDFVTAITSSNKGATQAELTLLESSIDTKISNLNYIKFVDSLPETGEEKYLYAVIQEETDREGHYIAVLYIWKNNQWYLSGAFSVNFDPNDYLLKTEAASTYLKLAGGTLTGNLLLSKDSGQSSISISCDGGLVIGVDKNNYTSVGNTGRGTNIYTSAHTNLFHDYLVSGNLVSKRILDEADKAVANGLATLDANTKIPVAQLPDLSNTYLPLTGGTLSGKLTAEGGIEVTGINNYTVQTGASFIWKHSADATKTGYLFYNPSNSNRPQFRQGTSGSFSNLLLESDKSVANGLATLDANAQVPIAQLPIDTELSQSSTNLLSNKTITEALMQVSDVTKRGIYELSTTVASSGSNITITLHDSISVYNIKPLVDSTITFDTSELTVPDTAMTSFYVIVDFSEGNVTLNWPSSVIWGNISPTGTAMVKYMYSFMQPYGENVWIGNEMQSWPSSSN